MTAEYADYDHHSVGATLESVYQAWADLQSKCPIGRSQSHGGMWVVTGYPETVNILRNPEVFSSFPATLPSFPQSTRMIPVEMDPPEHQRYRAPMAEPFSPKRAAQYETPLRSIVNGLIDKFVETGRCDAFEAIAVPLPALLATMFLGVPIADAAKLQGWIHTLVHETAARPEAAGEAIQSIYGYFQELLSARRADPLGDDLLSVLLHTEIDGSPLSDDELLGFSLFLLLASIDTSQKVIGSMFWHLATDTELRRKLASDSSLIPAAVEEFLRYWAPVVGARRVTKDTEIDGLEMKAGDRVLLLLGAANRDDRAFEQASEFSLDRKSNKHLAFGDYIHKCLGIHIARVELKVLLEEFLRRIPDFEVQPGETPLWSNGQVQGVVKAPIRFAPGPKETQF